MSEFIINKIDDYNVDLDLFLEQFKDSEKLNAIMEAANNSANYIETAIFDIREAFDLETAIGVQLDIIGSIFTTDRNGEIDEVYRLRIQRNASTHYSGEPEAIISIIKSTFGATYVYYRPGYPGKYYIRTDAEVSVVDLIPLSPAGVDPLIENIDLVDAVGNNIVDALGNLITTVTDVERLFIIDAQGNALIDGNGNNIIAIR